MKRKAFTLSEVLLVLALISVVSALTIPTLINNTGNKQQTITWKKEFSVLSQAANLVMKDNGGNLQRLCTTDGDDDCVATAFSQYLKVLKVCPKGPAVAGNCWPLSTKKADGTASGIDSTASGFILNDGSMVLMKNEKYANCDMVAGKNICGYMWVDVNGFKNPNKIGTDIFFIDASINSLSPGGAPQGRDITAFCGATCGADASSTALAK